MNRILRAAFGLPEPATEARAVDPSPFNVGPSIENMGSGAEKALRLVPLYAGVSQIADGFASLPLHAYRPVGDARERTTLPELFVNPSAAGTIYDWKHKLIVSLLLRGNAYGYVTAFDARGWPKSIEWLHPDGVHVDESTGMPRYSYGGQPIERHSMLHIPAFTQPGSCVGLSIVANFGMTIDAGLYAQAGTRDFYKNGSVPSHHLKNTEQTLNAEESAEIKQRYRASVRTGEPIVTGKDWELGPLGLSAQDAQFLDAIKANATQIAALLRLPPEDIGGERGSSLTYSTTEMDEIRYLSRTLRPWVTRAEAAFERITPAPVYVRFNADAMLRTDAKTRAEVYEIALRNKYLTTDEVRALEDRPALPPRDGKAWQDVGLPALVEAGIVSPAWAASQVGAPTDGLPTTAAPVLKQGTSTGEPA